MPNSEYGNGQQVNLNINGADLNKIQNVYNNIYGNGNPNLHTGSKSYFKEKYYYDANSNIKYVKNSIGVISHTYDAENRLTQKGAASFSYDVNGNMLTETAGQDKTYYSYSSDNRLSRVVKPVDQQENSLRFADYSYDALGRRVSRTKYESHNNRIQLGDYSAYTYTGNGLDIAGKVDYKGNGQSYRFESEKEYIYALGSAVTQREFDQNGRYRSNERKYMYQDALGSVTHIYKGNSHQEDIRYGAWGEFLDTYHGNGNTEEYTNAGVLFGYNGKAYDSFSKLYNYGYRDLSVTRKQWQTQDPIRDGLNWQTYLGGVADPVNMIDAYGLCGEDKVRVDEQPSQIILASYDGKLYPLYPGGPMVRDSLGYPSMSPDPFLNTNFSGGTIWQKIIFGAGGAFDILKDYAGWAG